VLGDGEVILDQTSGLFRVVAIKTRRVTQQIRKRFGERGTLDTDVGGLGPIEKEHSAERHVAKIERHALEWQRTAFRCEMIE